MNKINDSTLRFNTSLTLKFVKIHTFYWGHTQMSMCGSLSLTTLKPFNITAITAFLLRLRNWIP